jgi:hypothetical protein
MIRNVGTADRIIRAILGIVIIGLGLTFKSWWGIVGIILLLTSAVGICGLYIPFGFNTCTVKKPKE